MNASELSIVEREVLCGRDRILSSNYVEAKIKEALKAGQSEFNQKLLLGVQDIANAVVTDFKDQLRAELQVATNDWIVGKNTLEIVPNGTKYLGSLGNGRVCVVEYGPSLKTLDFKTNLVVNGRTTGGVGKFRLAFPYIVFIIRLLNPNYLDKLTIQQVYVGCRTKPLQSLDDIIYHMPLPNCDGDYHICLGGDWTYIDENRKQKCSLAEMVESVIGYFWNSGFNNDLSDQFVKFTGRNPAVSNLKNWQENSTKDPLFALKLDWGSGVPVSRFLERNTESVRLNTSRIVDRVLASQKLTDYLRMVSQVNVNSQRSVNIIKDALYESMTATCGKVIESVKAKAEQDAKVKTEELSKLPQRKKEEPDRVKRYQDGNYLYYPPAAEVW